MPVYLWVDDHSAVFYANAIQISVLHTTDGTIYISYCEE